MKGEKCQVLVCIQVLPPESAGLTASAPSPVICIPKLEASSQIDGEVREDEWKGAAIAEPFRHYQTGQPMPKEIATEAFIGFDEKALYIAFVCLEPNPKGMRKSQWARDSDGVWQDESVEVFVAPEDNPSKYAHIVVNAAGSVYDEFVFDVSLDADIQVSTSIASDRWICELSIPWSSLPFIKSLISSPQSLRLNFCRNRHQIDKGATHWAWSPTFGWFHTPERFGIGKLETGNVVVTHVRLPRYFGENQIVLSLHNKSKETEKVQVNGQQITLPPRSYERVRLQVPASIGEHRNRINLRWGNEQRSFEIAYTVPEPLKLISPVALADEEGKVDLTLAINLSPDLMSQRALILETDKKRIRLPLTSTSLQFRFLLQGLSTSIRLWLDNAPNQAVTCLLVHGK